MRDFPSCFGENGVQVADTSYSSVSLSRAPQNIVNCIYQCKLLGKSCLIIISWSKNLMGYCLGVEINDLAGQGICRVDVKPSLFYKRKGSKCLQVNSAEIDIFWDLSSAKYGSGSQPVEGYYIGVVCKGEMVLLVGDMRKEAIKKANAVPSLFGSMFISKREHIFGKRVYKSRVQFSDNGQVHHLAIECETFGNNDPHLVVRLDSKIVMQIKHLQWTFRGNQTILVDGLPVQILWDVYNWLFGTNFGSATFMFQTCSRTEKLWASQTLDPSEPPWPCLQSSRESNSSDPGFALTLYAWKNE